MREGIILEPTVEWCTYPLPRSGTYESTYPITNKPHNVYNWYSTLDEKPYIAHTPPCLIGMVAQYKPDREFVTGVLESSWNLMAHGDAREGKWRGNWRMEWVASTLTLSRDVVYPELLQLMRTPRLSVVDWTDALADLNGLVRFAERPNLVSARVPSHFKCSLTTVMGLK